MKLDKANQYYAQTWAESIWALWGTVSGSRTAAEGLIPVGKVRQACLRNGICSSPGCRHACGVLTTYLEQISVTLFSTPLFTLFLSRMQIFFLFTPSAGDSCFTGRMIWSWSPDTAGNWWVHKKKERKCLGSACFLLISSLFWENPGSPPGKWVS